MQARELAKLEYVVIIYSFVKHRTLKPARATASPFPEGRDLG